MINVDVYKSIGTRSRALYINGDIVTYFWVEHVPKEIENFLENKNITTMFTECKQMIQ